MRDSGLLLESKPRPTPDTRRYTGRVAVAESNWRWSSDGFEFRCDNGEKLRVTFAIDCGDREALDWAASNGGYDSDTVQDVMLRSVECRVGQHLPTAPIEWLTDNGSAYRADETRSFAKMLGLKPRTTAIRSPQSNGVAESFVKTMKRDYIGMMPKPDSSVKPVVNVRTLQRISPAQRFRISLTRRISAQGETINLSENRCMDIGGQNQNSTLTRNTNAQPVTR